LNGKRLTLSRIAVGLSLFASASVYAAEPIPATTEITLERRCFGCEGPYKVALHRDGSATRVVFGNARAGTIDRSFEGTVDRAEFERIATLIRSGRFFDFEDEYRDPRLQDGASVTTSAVRGGVEKRVQNRNHAGPEGLAEIEQAIDLLAAKIAWKPTAAN
jgi:hypothetical protein